MKNKTTNTSKTSSKETKHAPGKLYGLTYHMHKNPILKYSCFINNGNGDSVCKMLRDDAPDYDTQESWAKQLQQAINEYDKLKADHAKMLEALKECKEYFDYTSEDNRGNNWDVKKKVEDVISQTEGRVNVNS